MKKVILALAFVLGMVAPSFAYDIEKVVIGAVGQQAVTTSTKACLVGFDLACGGVCTIEIRNVSGGSILWTKGLGAAGHASEMIEYKGCGGKPGIPFSTGVYYNPATASTTRGTLYITK